jgi:hypothetical protein
MEQAALKKILINALDAQQINHSLADAIAAAAGFNLTEVVDPVKTADDLRLIGHQLLERGVIGAGTANTFAIVADSIFEHIDSFEEA